MRHKNFTWVVAAPLVAIAFLSQATDSSANAIIRADSTHVKAAAGVGGRTGTATTTSLRWSQVAPAMSPPARIGATMTYDPARKGLILFGGQGAATQLNDTWLWTGLKWKELAPPISPPPRLFAAMAYDGATKQLVLFGGEGCTGYCADTWVWQHGKWTLEHPAEGPVGRDSPMMAYDPRTRQLLMFGGQNPACGTDCPDTWSWNGQTWTEVNANGPQAGGNGAMAYDPNLGKIVLYGGDNAKDTQTWAWSGKSWNQIGSVGPCNTSYDSMASDVKGSVVLFGGYGLCTFQSTTEVWARRSWKELPTTVFPSARAFAVMAYDPLAKQTVLFSGQQYDGGLLDDTWALGDGCRRSTATPPSFRHVPPAAGPGPGPKRRHHPRRQPDGPEHPRSGRGHPRTAPVRWRSPTGQRPAAHGAAAAPPTP